MAYSTHYKDQIATTGGTMTWVWRAQPCFRQTDSGCKIVESRKTHVRSEQNTVSLKRQSLFDTLGCPPPASVSSIDKGNPLIMRDPYFLKVYAGTRLVSARPFWPSGLTTRPCVRGPSLCYWETKYVDLLDWYLADGGHTSHGTGQPNPPQRVCQCRGGRLGGSADPVIVLWLWLIGIELALGWIEAEVLPVHF